MAPLFRVLRRTDTGVEVIAEIDDNGIVTGRSAEFVRWGLEHYGGPGMPLEEALYRFIFTCSTYYGYERVDGTHAEDRHTTDDSGIATNQ